MRERERKLTFGDGAGSHEQVDAGGAGAVADDGDVGRVAAERRDVLLHPVQRRDLVHEPVVGRRPHKPVTVGVQEAWKQ